jgi:hypothetical protein
MGKEYVAWTTLVGRLKNVEPMTPRQNKLRFFKSNLAKPFHCGYCGIVCVVLYPLNLLLGLLMLVVVSGKYDGSIEENRDHKVYTLVLQSTNNGATSTSTQIVTIHDDGLCYIKTNGEVGLGPAFGCKSYPKCCGDEDSYTDPLYSVPFSWEIETKFTIHELDKRETKSLRAVFADHHEMMVQRQNNNEENI